MDRLDFTKKIKEIFDRYKYVLLILFIGIFLMLLPGQTDKAPQQETATPESMPVTCAEELEDILSQMEGVGKVKVLLTEADGAQTIYQTDEDRTDSHDNKSLRVETVIVTNGDRGEAGLIRSVTPPVYLGAIIVCQGGDIPSIKLAIVQAVSGVTGISSDRIAVLKMK